MAYLISKNTIWPIFKLFIKEIKGIENIPNKPFIMMSNHQSYIDGPLLIMLIAKYKNKQIKTFAVKDKFNNLFWKKKFEHFGAIKVNGSVQKGLDELKKNHPLLLFPEGRRTSDGKIQKTTHTGAGVIAQTKKPIVPVYLNTYNFWNRKQTIPNFKKIIKIKIGKPFTIKIKNPKKATQKIMEEVKACAKL